jgi:cyanophycinase-like exopeptidase
MKLIPDYGLLAAFAIFLSNEIYGQSYTSYMTGDAADASPQPQFGLCLMGGAGEDDEAMKWFLQRANGGDVVVIRATGSNGYNNYMYSQLGVTVNSVETIVFHNASAASDPYVIQQLQNAEAIWIAGGNQATYVNEWKNTAVEQAINDLLNVKGGVVGGTSAGMAILGGSYFSATSGTVTSATALGNPYANSVQIGHGDFIQAPFLQNVITDTHFDNPDRRGRLTVFMARMMTDQGILPLGIACDEYTAVCIGSDGIAHCYGEAPQYEDYAYFARPNCPEPIGPETCQSGTPLTWNRNGEALKVYRINATADGSRTFDLNNWQTGTGGEWLNWSVQNSNFTETPGATAPDCAVVGVEESVGQNFHFFPNPTTGLVRWTGQSENVRLTVMDISGKVLIDNPNHPSGWADLSSLPSGLCIVKINGHTSRIVKE